MGRTHSYLGDTRYDHTSIPHGTDRRHGHINIELTYQVANNVQMSQYRNTQCQNIDHDASVLVARCVFCLLELGGGP